jgi:hypothetical protein
MNATAILHPLAAVAVGAGIFLSGRVLTVSLLVLGAALFVAGLVAARRDGTESAEGA